MTGKMQMPRRGKSPDPLSDLVEYRFKFGADELMWFAKGFRGCKGHNREDWAEQCAVKWQLRGSPR